MQTQTTFNPNPLTFKQGARRFIRYGAASLTSAGIDLAAFSLLLRAVPETAGGIFAATAIARILSGVFNFFVNRGWVFRQNGNSKRQALYYMCLFFGQILTSALLVCALSSLTIHLTAGKACVDTALFIISYQIQSRRIFRNTTDI